MQYAFVLSALLGGAFAAPAIESRATSFRIPVRRVTTGDASSNRANSRVQIADAAALSDKIDFNSYWFANTTAGGEPLDIVLDTGSAVFWVLAPGSPAAQKSGQEIYDPSKSSTSQRVSGETYSISYGSGGNGVSGPVYTDRICVGTACVRAPIGLANNLNGIPAGSLRSGLMGLSFGASSQYTPTKLPTFMEALQKNLAQPVFVCNFKIDDSGFIEFGTIDSSLYQGSLQTIQIDNSTGSWDNNQASFYAGGKQLGGPITMNFDTGSPNTYLPNATIANYHAQIQGSSYTGGRWQFPCSSAVPDFQMHFFAGQVATIPGRKMVEGTIDNGKTCVTWMIPVTGRGSVGDAFFNSNVVVFNQAVPNIQFALQK